MPRRFLLRCRPQDWPRFRPGLRAACLAAIPAALLAASVPAKANALLEALDAAAARRAAAAAEPIRADSATPSAQASAGPADPAAQQPGHAATQAATQATSKAQFAGSDPTAGTGLPAISIIIDDIGYSRELGAQLLDLPRPVTLAILPHSPHGAALARRAQRSGHEIMLHLPMESSVGADSGPGTLAAGMSDEHFTSTLVDNLRAIPGISGVNNHMGSLLTSRRDAMQRLMGGIAARGDLFFIDSRTTTSTVAEETARLFGIPSTRRDVFLDNRRNAASIDGKFDELLRRARLNGHAVAIGHPYPETIAVLRRRLSQLHGIRLIRVDQQIAERPPSSVTPLAQRP